MSGYQEQKKDWLICPHCAEIQKIVAISADHEMRCFNCGAQISTGRSRWLSIALSVSISAFILFLAANYLPFLTLEVGIQTHTVTIIDGVIALIERTEWLLAGLVFTTLFLFPLVELIAFIFLLSCYHFKKTVRGQKTTLRWLIKAQHWNMLDIFMLSVVVTAFKLTDLAYVKLESGAYLFFALVALLQLVFLRIDKRSLWQWINANNYFCNEKNEYAYDCRCCKALVGESIVEQTGQCPRCHSTVHKRIPASLQKTTALVFAASILYVPANILPIMEYTSVGITERDTIMSGVIKLLQDGLWGIASIVFVASIVVPIIKLLVFYYLLWAVKARATKGVKQRAALFRFVDLIGRWSMVDVFVVTILVALVQFGFVYTVEPQGALIAFGAVVVLTMLAAETFDPRLLWDAQLQAKEDQAKAEQAKEHSVKECSVKECSVKEYSVTEYKEKEHKDEQQETQ